MLLYKTSVKFLLASSKLHISRPDSPRHVSFKVMDKCRSVQARYSNGPTPLAVRVFVSPRAGELDALHRRRCWGCPLRRLCRSRLLLLLLLLERWQDVGGRCWRACILLGQHARNASIHVRLSRIGALEVLPNRSYLTTQQLILLLGSTAVFGLGSESDVLSTHSLVDTREILDVLDSYPLSATFSLETRPSLHFVKISHLLDLLPGELGKMALSSSNRFFISLLRFRSAIL